MKKILVLFGVAVMLLGCGGGGGDDSTASNNLNTDSMSIEEILLGTWRLNGADCRLERLNSQPTGESVKVIYTFENSSDITVNIKKYINSTCDVSGLDYDLSGTIEYSLGAKGQYSTGDETYEIDWVVTGWTLHQGSFTYPSDNEFDDVGVVTYGLILLQGEKLYFSDDTADRNGSTRETRHNIFALNEEFWQK